MQTQPNNESVEKHSGVARVFSSLRNKLFAGIVLAIPVVVTIWVLNLAYNTISGISRPLLVKIGIDFPSSSFLITLLFLMLLGVMGTNVLGKKVLGFTDKLLAKVPFVGAIYGSVKQIIESMKTFGSGANFKRVVYVEYPAPGHRLLGFVTGQHVLPEDGRHITTIFLPTAPNPMTGFVLAVDTDKVVESGIGLEEATKIILSAGLVGRSSLPNQAGIAPEMPHSDTFNNLS